MSGVRRVYLDRSVGESRGVITLDGKPERLLIERVGQAACQKAGTRLIARVARIERGLATAFLELPEGDAVTPLAAGLVEGAAVEIEIISEAHSDKSAVARVLGPSDGAPRLLTEGPSLEERLAAFAPSAAIVEGAEVRQIADEAQAAALAIEHRLPGGGSITIEPVRALTAIDVDMGERGGGDARRAARQTNLAAIATAARLLRLKGLGGLVVIDLVGKGHDGPAMSAAAKAAFAPDGPQVSIGPISRFGLFELALPRHQRPVLDILTGTETVALDMIRTMEREWRANPGSSLRVSVSEEIGRIAKPYLAMMSERFGIQYTLAVLQGACKPYEVVAQ